MLLMVLVVVASLEEIFLLVLGGYICNREGRLLLLGGFQR
jgi:hypothetical protein